MRNNLIQNQEYLAQGRESLSNPSGLNYLDYQEFIKEEEEYEEEDDYSTVTGLMKFEKKSTKNEKNFQDESDFIETKEILKIRDFGEGYYSDYEEDESSFFDDKSRYINFKYDKEIIITEDRIENFHKKPKKNFEAEKIEKKDSNIISHLKLNSLKTEDFDNIEDEFTVNKNLAKIINNNNQNFDQSLFQDSRSPNPYFSKNSQNHSKNENLLSQSSLMENKESSFIPMIMNENFDDQVKEQIEMTYRSNYPYSSDNRAFLQKISLEHYNCENRNVDNLGFFDYLEECRDQILVTWRLHQDIEYNEELIDYIGQKVRVEGNNKNSKKIMNFFLKKIF